MASSSIPLPALDVRPAQSPDALSQYGKALEMKSLLGQQQLEQQQVQQNELQLEQSRALIGAAKGVDWTKDDAFDKFLNNANSSGKVSPQVLSSMSLQRAQYKEQLAKTDLAGLSVEKEANSQLLGHIDALKGITDPAKRAQASQDQATQILSNPELLKHVQPQTLQMLGAMKSGQYVPDDEHLTFFENGLTDRMSQADLAEKNAKASAEASQAALNQIKINLSKNSKPGDFDKLIDQAAPQNGPNASLNLRTKSMVNFALERGDYEGAQKAIEQMSGQIGGVEKEIAINTNPQIQAGKEAVAEAEGRARANIETQTARGSNAALAQVPPHLIQYATQTATKAAQDYDQAKSVSDRLSAMMDAARNGNVVSYQLIPQEGALQVTTSQGVHRINMAEIQNYGGGSLWQRMQGHLGKALTGESIPKSVLDDMAEMQQIQAQGSREKYEADLKAINANTGSNFQPMPEEKSKITTSKAVVTKTYQGHTYEQQSDGSWKLK